MVFTTLARFIALAFPLVNAGAGTGHPASTVAFAAPPPPRVSGCAPFWTAPIVTSAAILMTSSAAFAGEANLLNGATLFQANCAGCHANGMNFISEKKNLKKEALVKYQSLDQAQLQQFVQQKMPHKLLPFSKTMTDENYFDATSYVLDQALNEKWGV
ncbi:hypothetical protein MPSEU_000529200 [Mayamaea pseudoterrestris]|nr:hypothetical protein MPSEU_000529200 [Mayamaea pseudoterrestris]